MEPVPHQGDQRRFGHGPTAFEVDGRPTNPGELPQHRNVGLFPHPYGYPTHLLPSQPSGGQRLVQPHRRLFGD
jgi:hypothetical protein